MSEVISFSDEQAMLLETAMDFCANQSPISKVRAAIESHAVMDTEQWQSMAELGWMGIAIPEAYGGLGLSLGSVVPVIESMGRQVMGSPFFATTLAAQALVHGDNEALKAAWLGNIAAGTVATMALLEEDGNWDLSAVSATATREGDALSLSGEKTMVLDAASAELVLASVQLDGKVVLVAITDLPASNITREVVIDETRRAYRLSLDGISVAADQVISGEALPETELAALLLLTAEMAGGMQGTLNLIVEYLGTRKAFDRYIGSYQALKHPAVDILLDMEAARSHVYRAATLWTNEASAIDRERAVRIAKAHTSAAFAFAGDRAVQFHGGMGFTFECDAQLYLRRAIWSQYQYGDEKHQRAILAPLMLG